MPRVTRVLDTEPVVRLADHIAAGGGKAIELARAVPAMGIVEALEASGLRGRGGAGFPTGTKWRTVAEYGRGASPATVVVNAAEGEPGTYKDRAIVMGNPYRVIEGALVGAAAVAADRVIIAIKASETDLHDRVLQAIKEVEDEGWCASSEPNGTARIALSVTTGPEEYLFGEETGLLEVLAGRQPFPRVAPPFRWGLDQPTGADGTSAGARMASPAPDTTAPPTLVNNAETFANVPGIIVEGPDWFRSVGTEGSPGTIVCTVSGDTPNEGVGEFAMGTPLAEVLCDLGGLTDPRREVGFVLSGVANPLITPDQLDAPLDYEAMREAGGGLGTGGFLVFGPERDPVAVVAGVSRFLGVESCGQCTPCKHDGVALAALLDGLRRGEPDPDAVSEINERTSSVTVEARCFLANQHELVVGSLLERFPDAVKRAAAPNPSPDRPRAVLIAPITGWDGERFVLDERQWSKQPDWTYDPEDSGKSPAERFDQDEGEA